MSTSHWLNSFHLMAFMWGRYTLAFVTHQPYNVKLGNRLLIFLPEILQCDSMYFGLNSKILNALRSGKVHTMLLKFMLSKGWVKAPCTSWDNMWSSSVLKHQQELIKLLTWTIMRPLVIFFCIRNRKIYIPIFHLE